MATKQIDKAQASAPINQDEIDSTSLFRAVNKVIADCKGRDHVSQMERADKRSQTTRSSSGTLSLRKDADDESKARQKAIAGLEAFLDASNVLKLEVPVHLIKMIRGLQGKQAEKLESLALEKELASVKR
jgi:hypothetical protein